LNSSRAVTREEGEANFQNAVRHAKPRITHAGCMIFFPEFI